MEKRELLVAEKLKVAPRWVSGLLRVQSILDGPEEYFDKREQVGGWVRKIRAQQKHVFIELNDGSSVKGLQIVVSAAMPEFELIAAQNIDACVRVTGRLVRSPARGQTVEMAVDDPAEHKVELMGANSAPGRYPLQTATPTPEFLRQHLHLRPRSLAYAAMTRLRSRMSFAVHAFFQQTGLYYIHTPIITASDCEGAGEMFQVTTLMQDKAPKDLPVEDGRIDYRKDFFNRAAFLTVSGQLAVENFACAMSGAYTFGPTFRAENSKTVRHLSEFWMIEPEIAFAGIEELFALIEESVKYCISTALLDCGPELEFFNEQYKREPRVVGEAITDLIDYLRRVVDTPFARMSYTAAVEYLQGVEAAGDHKFEVAPVWGIDLGSEHERYICEHKTRGPVFLHDYPKEIKAFYMRLNDDGRTVRNTDLLLPFVGELAGGSVREERLEQLEAAYARCGLRSDDYAYYNDLRRYGTVPHTGFGIGFERLLMMLTATRNIRDTLPFPREPGICDC